MMNFRTILIVDDEPRARQGLKKTLESWSAGKHEIFCAANGEEAINMMNQRTIHLLITDIRMPEMTGLKLIKSIEKQKSKPVVIIISAYSEFEYAQEAITLGVVNYLLKPIDKHKLIHAVEQAIKIWEERQKAAVVEKMIDNRVINIQEGTRSQVVKEAIRFIHENLNRPFSLREVSSFVHLNPSYFSTLFKEETNMTFSEYVTRCRLQKAKSLLITTDLSIAEIAEEVGYQTAKYFIKLFKEFEGITPYQFRKENLKKVEF
jgi:two-component system, response regulator YesN